MTIDTAVVLAAGEGRRLRPLTANRPKPMLPAGTRPILEYVFDALIDAGVEDLNVVVGYRRDRVQDHFGPTYRGRPITYHVQRKQLGSGHALSCARDAVDGEFLVVNGDEVVAADVIRSVADAHTDADACTLAVLESTDAPLYGAVRLDGDTVVELVEKPGSGSYRLLNAGVYAFRPEFFDRIDATERDEGELALTDPISSAVADGAHVRGVKVDGRHSKVTFPWDLPELAATLLADGMAGDDPDGRGASVAAAATVSPDATLYPPVVVAADAVVEPGAVVGPDAAVGRNATVESGAVVRRSVLDTDARVGANATVVDSVLGRGAAVGEGATAPGGPADIRVDDRVHVGEQLGCVLGDRARLGGGSTVVPGVLVGPNARVDPGSVLRRNVDADAEVRD
ncbi:sugar phosphate nucleotidyltransferase [Halobaculum lipolyticum]|uniref:Bifunctional protein GlmU n=1 Tax=Halobaculum lipolyticum TaxID=3032001 RepID=A0ABD5WBR0_9EURY|nr:sugar phosphate nucleotidyltransferase [Halobaculum sp. DT31]